MRVNLITNITEQKGLQKDYELLRELLLEMGHRVEGVHFLGGKCPKADLNIFLETVVRQFIDYAPVNTWMPNPEWAMDEYLACLPRMKYVFCKTLHAVQLFAPLCGEKAVFTGFFSEDHYRPEIPRENRFLHAPGGSNVRNTEAIIEAWERYALPYPLTVVTSVHKRESSNPNITFHRRVSNEQLIQMQNSHSWHLVTGAYEGFGHWLHESMSVGAGILSIAAPPMNEWPAFIRLMSVGAERLRLAYMQKIAAYDVAESVKKCWEAYFCDWRFDNEAREVFKQERPDFKKRIEPLLAAIDQEAAVATNNVTTAPSPPAQPAKNLPDVLLLKQRYRYPWEEKWGSYPDEKTRDIHSLLDLVDSQSDVIADQTRRLAEKT